VSHRNGIIGVSLKTIHVHNKPLNCDVWCPRRQEKYTSHSRARVLKFRDGLNKTGYTVKTNRYVDGCVNLTLTVVIQNLGAFTAKIRWPWILIYLTVINGSCAANKNSKSYGYFLQGAVTKYTVPVLHSVFFSRVMGRNKFVLKQKSLSLMSFFG
jgi:hypothetical protein